MKIADTYKGLNYVVKIEGSDIPVEGSFDYGNEEENQKYLERFHNGELENLDILITIFSKSGHVEGFDSLGGCHVRASHIEEDIKSLIEDHGMIENAFQHLQDNLKEIQKKDLAA